MAFKQNQRVKIVGMTDGHCFKIGEVVTVINGEQGAYRCRGETGKIWWTTDHEMEAVEPMTVVPVRAVKFEPLQEKPAPAPQATGKMIYAVVNKDGILEIEQDRDDARVIKAELGGLKAGVTIVQYAPVKEIR